MEEKEHIGTHTFTDDDLVRIKHCLDAIRSYSNAQEIDRIQELLDKDLDSKEIPKRRIEVYKKILSLLNTSSLFAALGTGSGTLLGLAMGSALLPAIGAIGGTMLGLGVGFGLIKDIYKELVDDSTSE